MLETERDSSLILVRRAQEIIPACQYLETWCDEHCTASPDFPGDPVFRRYLCSSQALLEAETYPVWFTDVSRTRELDLSHPAAVPIRFREFLEAIGLLERRLKEARDSGRPRRKIPHVIVEHCEGCERRIVKDGCKGLLLLAVEGGDVELRVTEISGCEWSQAMHDMRLVCRCPPRVKATFIAG